MKTLKPLTPLLITFGLALSFTGCQSAPKSSLTNREAPVSSLETKRNPAGDGKIYTYESDENGFNTRNYFYDNGEEVVAFDTQFTPELAQKSIDYLRTQTSHPITYVVISHPNPDKFNGMSVFQALGAKVIASKKTADNMPGVHAYKKYFFVKVAKMFTDDTYPKLSTVDKTFDEKDIIQLKNGETIQLEELSQPGVSTNQTVALIPQVHAVIVGDLIHYHVHAWLEGGIVNGKAVPTLAGWIADLKELQDQLSADSSTTLYGGRGDSVSLKEGVKEQIHYLEKADHIVTQYVKNLGSNKSELLDDKVSGKHWKALQNIFKNKFKNYGLDYMIGYGVYGLADSKL